MKLYNTSTKVEMYVPYEEGDFISIKEFDLIMLQLCGAPGECFDGHIMDGEGNDVDFMYDDINNGEYEICLNFFK